MHISPQTHGLVAWLLGTWPGEGEGEGDGFFKLYVLRQFWGFDA